MRLGLIGQKVPDKLLDSEFINANLKKFDLIEDFMVVGLNFDVIESQEIDSQIETIFKPEIITSIMRNNEEIKKN